MPCDVEQLGGRWHLILSLSQLWSQDGKWRCCSHNNKTVMCKRSIWLLHHWAEGALSKMNAEVPATKLTLTCQINSISRERERRRKRQQPELFWQVLLDGDKDNTDRNSDLQLRSDYRQCQMFVCDHVSHCHQAELLIYCLSIHVS